RLPRFDQPLRARRGAPRCARGSGGGGRFPDRGAGPAGAGVGCASRGVAPRGGAAAAGAGAGAGARGVDGVGGGAGGGRGAGRGEAVTRVAGFTPGLKWPNDLVVGDRKLAGILTERDGDAVVVGTGVNVDWHEFPPEIAATATACNLEAGHAVDRRALLDAFLAELDARYTDLGDVTAEYRSRLATLGRRVGGARAADALVGRAVGVGALGQLLVEDNRGEVVEVQVGDVVPLRDA